MHRQLIALTSTSVDRRRLALDKLQLAMSNPDTFGERFAEWINAWQEPVPTAVEPIKYLRPVRGAESLILDPTDGSRIFAESAGIFTGHLDPDFQVVGEGIKCSPTPMQKVSVHELVADGEFADIYGSVCDDLDSLCLTQDQIIQFVQKHPSWLNSKCWAIFFLYKVEEKFFVADVTFEERRALLYATVFQFPYASVWGARRLIRFVIPQFDHQTT